MTIRHHPSEEILLRHANGSLSAPLSLVVRAHLDGCGECAKTVQFAESIGGAFLETMSPAAMSAEAFSRVLDRLDEPVEIASRGDTAAKPIPGLTLPPALQACAIGERRSVAPGIWIRRILKDPAQGTRAYLLGVAAGKALPHHGHLGIELTQVLKGAFFEGATRYEPGDLLQTGAEHGHRQTVDADQECVCVIASEGVPRGPIGLLMRAFT
jgi:putative transcriptional regulator